MMKQIRRKRSCIHTCKVLSAFIPEDEADSLMEQRHTLKKHNHNGKKI